jgi:hypothetical protein
MQYYASDKATLLIDFENIFESTKRAFALMVEFYNDHLTNVSPDVQNL